MGYNPHAEAMQRIKNRLCKLARKSFDGDMSMEIKTKRLTLRPIRLGDEKDLDFAFQNLGIDKVYAQCDIKNPASFGVMRKIGMKCINDKGTRTYPRTGITSGEYTCLITREEWEKK